MPIPELVEYIQAQTQEGITAEDLRAALMEAGWQELDINNALHDVAAGLHPATPGASIHADLAQVRGMVAHLASRVKGIESAFASLASMPTKGLSPMQAQLPSKFIGAEHELSSRRRPSLLSKVISLMSSIILAGAFGFFATELVNRNVLALRDYLVGTTVLGGLVMIIAIILMRRRRLWSARFLSAVAVALWATDTYIAWRVNHYLEWSVAGALALLLVVISLVIGRWLKRLGRQ